MTQSRIIFSTVEYQYFANRLAALTQYAAGVIEVKTFPDGERYHRIVDSVYNRDVILVGGATNDSETLEVYDLACALVKQGASRLTIVMPYYAYSTMERAVQEGEVVKGKTRARLFSAIPLAPLGNRILLFDLHSEGLPYYFEGGIVPVHLYGKTLVREACHRIAGDSFILACTDAGRAKWVESLANDMKVEAAFVFKQRLSGTETRITGVSASVEGQNVIIYDDMIRTGGSLIQAAKAYRDAGATHISAVATHGVLPGESVEKLRASSLFDEVIVTDSHPNALQLADGFLHVHSAAPVYADFLLAE
jgi:ribose-phosphate pyrophosphokinase